MGSAMGSSAETPPTPPLPPAPSGPPPVEPAGARRLVRHLPRAVLILFVVAILVIFREVLLPFVLAVFCAYLIFPVVQRLERIPIGRGHPPRWLAVISVYALIFIVGWWTIPPLIANFAEQVRKLVHDVPSLFERLQAQRKQLDVAVASMLEVKSLSETSRREIFADVDALAVGSLVAFEPPEGLVLPPPPPEEPPVAAKDDAPPPPPTIVQIFGFNLQISPAPPASEAALPPEQEATPSHDGTDAPAEPPSPADPSASAGEGEAPVEQPPRFDGAKGDAFKTALRDAINAELEQPGPAKGIAAKIEREIVPELAQRELAIPSGDPQLERFARNTAARVATVVRREDDAAIFTAYIGSGMNSARAWVQGKLAGVPGLATGLGYGLVRGIFDFFMVLMLTAFFLVFFPRIRDYGRDLVAPAYRDHYAQVLKRIDTRLSGAIRGQVIICIVNAVLTFPGLWFIGAHTDATNLAGYAVLLSVIAGVLSMIPIFGVILSTVPMVILALAQGSLWGAVLVIGWICVIHAIEAYLLNPNILGHSASMNPIIVVFALLAGKQLYGLTGALLAVPVASVLVSVFGYYRRLVAEGGREQGAPVVADTWGD